jgi:tetratricopeptide (TPR) repeat protein
MSAVPDSRPTRRSVAQRIGQQHAVQRARFHVVRVARKLSYQALDRGDKRSAVRITAAVVRRFPDYPFAVRLYAHALLAAPARRADAEHALEVLASILVLQPSDQTCRVAFVEALHLLSDLGGTSQDVVGRLRTLVALPEGAGLPATRQFLERQRSWGRVDVVEAAVAVLLDCRGEFESRNRRQLATLAHDAAVLTDDLELAADVAAIVSRWSGVTDEDRAHMNAATSLASGSPMRAVEILAELPVHRPAKYSRQLVASHLVLGRHDLVLDYLEAVSHELPDAEALVLRYDALHALGRFDEADALAATIEPAQLADPNLFRVFRDFCERHPRECSATFEEAVRTFESEAERNVRNVAALAAIYFELGRLDDVDRIHRAAAREGGSLLGSWARLTVAKAMYARRQFDEAVRMLDTMSGSSNRWDAEKLRARILVERGDFDGAIALRNRFRDASGDVDEVLYHGLLQRRRMAEAFAVYLPRRDRLRLAAVFGDRAEFGPEFPSVRRRLAISQAGPGDELAIAATYRSLRSTCDELFVTCDPRLLTLLGRSYPDIEFLAVERLRPHQAGALGPGREARAGNVLYDLLTERAMDVAAECDGVVLGRSLLHLTIGSAPGPYGNYLRPDADLMRRFDASVRNGSRRVGVVWRSELRGPMRDIHYLSVEDLQPLLARLDQFVCLQHDATASERVALEAMAATPVDFHDDIDLRNDFDSTAALVAGLDAVVGIGTTVLELSAAVGTPAIMLQPTHFGTWRAIDAGGSDFWHRSMRVVAIDQPWRRDLLVEAAGRMLDEIDVNAVAPPREHQLGVSRPANLTGVRRRRLRGW